MRILVLTQCYLPMTISGAKLISDLASEMARIGHDVTVVTPDDSLVERLRVSKEGSVTVARVRARTIRHPSKVVRALREIGLSRTIWNAARGYFEEHPCDLVVCYTPTIFWSNLVEKLKALSGCRSYEILRDIFPQWAVDTGILKRRSLAYLYFRWHEFRLYRLCDVIGVQSPANLEYFAALPPDIARKVEVLFNWTTPLSDVVYSDKWRSRFGLKGKVVFVYGGVLGVPQDIDNLLRLALEMRDEGDAYFLLIGDGSQSDRICKEIEQRGLCNIRVHPPVSQEDYLDIVAECDVGLVTLRRDLKTHNFPGKMLSYMQARKPILASINPGNDLGPVLSASEAGFVCINGEDQTLAGFARRLTEDSALRARMGANGHKLLVSKFNVSAAVSQITAHFSLDERRGQAKPETHCAT